jgi:hypothetical protein
MIIILLLALMVAGFFYVFRGSAVLLVLGLPAFGIVMLASGADNHGFAVGIIFFIFCWFVWVFRKHLRS